MTTSRDFIPYHSPILFSKAEKASGQIDGMVCAIMCSAAIEAFVNDLTEWYRYCDRHNQTCESLRRFREPSSAPASGLFIFKRATVTICSSFVHNLTDLERDTGNQLADMEQNHESICKKISYLYEQLTQSKWKKGTRLHQDFNLLVAIRNSAVHMKSGTLSTTLTSEFYPTALQYEGHPKFVRILAQRKLIQDQQELTAWMYMLDTTEFCDWALNTTFKIVQEIFDALPKSWVSQQFCRQARFI